MSTDAQPANAPEADPRFPSGPWRGHYIQFGVRSGQQFTLHFSGGIVSGMGRDPVGFFGVRGSYSTESGKVTLRKQYPAAHSVEYDGYAEVQHGIFGRWSIPSLFGVNDRGGFNIRPDGSAGLGERLSREADVSADAAPAEMENAEAQLAPA